MMVNARCVRVHRLAEEVVGTAAAEPEARIVARLSKSNSLMDLGKKHGHSGKALVLGLIGPKQPRLLFTLKRPT